MKPTSRTDTPSSARDDDLRASVARAVEVLLAGGVVAYPSETVWGLAAHPAFPGAVDRLYVLKGRPESKPVQVSCLDARVARGLAVPSAALEALVHLWPGPLTLVTPASAACPPALAPGGMVGLRVPAHPVAAALLERTGGVLATTSCNLSGQGAAVTFEEAMNLNLGDMVVPDGGVPAAGEASTVVALPGGQVLRSGALPPQRVTDALRAAGLPVLTP